MTKLNFLFVFLLFTQLHATQIRGRIFNAADKTPLAGANVYLVISGNGAVSDNEGYFSVKLPEKGQIQDTLVINFLGFEEKKILLSEVSSSSEYFLKPVKLTLEKSILVTGKRENLAKQEIPHSMEALDIEDVQRYGSSELGDLVKKMSSVRIEGNDLDGRKVQIRGSNSSEVNVYLDGVLLNGINQDNSADLSLIPAEQIGQMEILKGGNLPLLGQGAFGGVMNLFSRKVHEPEVGLKVKIGSFETEHLQASVQLPIIGNLFASYFGQFNTMRPSIEYFPGERFGEKSKNSKISTERMNHSLNLDYYGKAGELRAKYFNYGIDYDKPGWVSQKQTHLFSLSFTGINELQVGINRINSKDFIERYIIESTRNQYDYDTERLNIRISKNYKFKISNFQILSEYYHDELNTTSRLKDSLNTTTYYKASLYDNRAGLAGIYSFEDSFEESKHLSWRVFFGARGDFTAEGKRDFSNSWGARILYEKNNQEFIPYLSYGKNVKYPSLYQSAYMYDLVEFSNNSEIDATLKPEYNNSYELGSTYIWHFANNITEQIEFNNAFFISTTYNKILSRPFGEEMVQMQVGRNTTKGFEASLKLSRIFKYFSASIAYTKLDIDNPLLYEYKPEQNANIQLDFISQFGFYISTMAFYEGKSYAWYLDNNNELQTHRIHDSYDLDISLGYQLQWLGLTYDAQIAGYNIFDNGGYDYYYLKKRYLQASFSIKY